MAEGAGCHVPPVIRQWPPPEASGELFAELERTLAGGGLVAFPTDTVYGIGGRWDAPETDARLREAKGCDATRPFQALVAGVFAVRALAPEMPHIAYAFAERYWPGPLTIVVKSAAGDYVGLRRPNHIVAHCVVEAGGGVLLASSANRSGQAPVTSAKEAAVCFGERIALAVDGGPPGGGVASSVVRVTADGWELLREEAVSREELTRVAGAPPVGERG